MYCRKSSRLTLVAVVLGVTLTCVLFSWNSSGAAKRFQVFRVPLQQTFLHYFYNVGESSSSSLITESFRKVVPRFWWLFNNKSAFLYSAHFDSRDAVVKIVGFASRDHPPSNENVFCKFPDGSVTPFQVHYVVPVKKPKIGLAYDTWIWKCSNPSLKPPDAVEIRSVDNTVVLKVTYLPNDSGPLKGPVVCVKPMGEFYSDSYQLREFIEMNKILGVQKIVFYPLNINETIIRPILNEYEKKGFVDVYEWKPPVDPTTLHESGQKSHNQHCLYTYMYQYEWAAFFDLDELIIPTGNLATLSEMIDFAAKDRENQHKLAGFNIHSKLCATVLPDDESVVKNDMCLLTSIRKTNCSIPLDIGVWSKPLVYINGTEIVDIHEIHKARDGYRIVELSPSYGNVHHYRNNMGAANFLAYNLPENERDINTHKYNGAIKQVLGNSLCKAFNKNSI